MKLERNLRLFERFICTTAKQQSDKIIKISVGGGKYPHVGVQEPTYLLISFNWSQSAFVTIITGRSWWDILQRIVVGVTHESMHVRPCFFGCRAICMAHWFLWWSFRSNNSCSRSSDNGLPKVIYLYQSKNLRTCFGTDHLRMENFSNSDINF